ncbi:MAG TPA: anti-sigma factor [Candidatus Angelobacter sp.]|nr:anti-sigma factor [Candidatus Angelobacter sp.]
MSQHREEHLDLCAAHVLGCLDEADRSRLEAHLAEACPVCERALRDFCGSAVLLAASAPPAVVSPALKSKVLAAARAGTGVEGGRAKEGRIVPVRKRWAPPARLGWALAACFILATGILVVATSRLRQDMKRARGQVQTLTRDLDTERHWAAMLASPRARTASFSLTPAGEAALRARATVDPETHRAILVFQNFKAPSGHDYELWTLRGNTPASLGLIRSEPGGRVVLRIEDIGNPDSLTAFAISLEPEGGSPTPGEPTGPIVMIGSLGG